MVTLACGHVLCLAIERSGEISMLGEGETVNLSRNLGLSIDQAYLEYSQTPCIKIGVYQEIVLHKDACVLFFGLLVGYLPADPAGFSKWMPRRVCRAIPSSRRSRARQL